MDIEKIIVIIVLSLIVISLFGLLVYKLKEKWWCYVFHKKYQESSEHTVYGVMDYGYKEVKCSKCGRDYAI